MAATGTTVRATAQRPRRPVGRMLRRVAVYGLTSVVILVGLLAGGAYVVVQRTLPQTTGTLTVKGLEHSASVLRDAWGVPHITAQSPHDVAFTQGYVTAQDRLFQMDMNRHIAGGRLAEMFGPGPKGSLIDADKFLRTLGLYQAAQGERALLAITSPPTLAELQAYTDGVNAFISTHQSSLPLEFTLLGYSPQPWSVLDSLAYARVVALSLDDNWYVKYTRALLLAKVGPAVTSDLFPAYPAANPTLLTAAGQAQSLIPLTGGQRTGATGSAATQSLPLSNAARLPLDLLRGASVVQGLIGNISDSLGSNNWVVDGTRTTTGMPLLANDPHLGISMPAIWYQIGLRGTGGMDVIGFSFPGIPGVVIGHNDHIAWGVTNVDADNTDLFLEKLDPSRHPGMYEYNGQWLPLMTHREVIKVRGGSPVTLTITSTNHGPLLNGVKSDLKGFAPVALEWTAIQPGYTILGFYQLDQATNWQEFNAAIDNISISQNFIYADTSGNIGYRMSGLLPLRTAANDLLPVDGSVATHDWQGYLPQAEMPRLYDPPTHIIVTANNQIVPDSSPIYVTTEWDRGYRARRITDLLLATPKLSIADFERIQSDVYSIPSATLVPLLIAAGTRAGGDAAQAAHLLQGWDGAMTTTSTAAAVYEVTVSSLLRATLEPVLGKSLYGIYRSNYSVSGLYTVLLNQVNTPTAPFFGIGPATGDALASRNAVIAQALASAMAQLRSTLGNDPSKWTWGGLHKAHFAHPLATVPPLNLIFGTTPVATSGDGVTVSIGGDGGFSADPPVYDQHTVSSMRQIIDLANFDHSLWITTTGESGQPFSPHYADLIPLWAEHRYEPMAYSAAAEGLAGRALLILRP